MTYKELKLSVTNLKSIHFDIYTDKQFRLLAGNSVMTILSILADILSPRISKCHEIDPNIEFIYLSKDEQSSNLLSDDIQNILNKLLKGEKVDINYEESIKLRIISILLENYSLYQDIEKLYPICDDNLDYPINFLLEIFQYKFNVNQFSNGDNDCIQFIAKNFYKYEKEKLFKLPKTILLSIISSDLLMIKNEDELFEFINKLYQSNECKIENEDDIDITSFYELLDFNYLSNDALEKFINNLKTNQINSQIWLKIQNIFSLKINNMNINNFPIHKFNDKYRRVYCPFDGDGQNRFNGIIKYLTDKVGGNIVEKGAVKIEYKSDYRPWNKENQSGDVRWAVNLNDPNKYFDTNTFETGIMYLKYDFLDRKVQIDCYSIRSRPDYGKGVGHFMNWIIEGTNDDNDDKSWIRLDTRNNDFTMDEKKAENTFYISKKQKVNEYFKFIRIGASKNTYGNNAIVFSAFEFFGSILDD